MDEKLSSALLTAVGKALAVNTVFPRIVSALDQ